MHKTDRRNFIKSVGLVSGTALLAPGNIKGSPFPDDINMLRSTDKIILYPGRANANTIDLGMGYNWFDHLGSGGFYARWNKYPLSAKVYPEPDDHAGWNAIEKGLDELNPGWFRFGLPPDHHIDKNGNLIKDTINIKHLEWLNKWATRKNRVILLDLFVIPRYYEFPVPEGTEDPGSTILNMAAANNREYARKFVAPLLDYIVNELKLDAVRFFNPVNEPMEYGVYQTPGNAPSAMAHYVNMYREIREALNDLGIDNKRIGLVGLDCFNPGKYILEQHALGIDIDPYIEAYSVHHYNLRFDYLPPITTPDCGRSYFIKGINVIIENEDRQFVEYARIRKKPLWALEMGTFYYGKSTNPEGVASLDATITIAEGIIRAMNAGVTSFCIWSLLNSNSVDGHWAVMGEKNGELVRYKYPFGVFGILSNHFSPSANVIPFNMENAPDICNIHATAVENPGNLRNILIVNDHPEKEMDLELKLPENWPGSGNFITSMADSLHPDQIAGIIHFQDGIIRITCPPLSLTGLKYST